MDLYHLFAQCAGVYYPSKEKVDINLYLYNFSDIPIIFSNVQIVFDFHIYFLNNEEIYVSPKSHISKDYCFFLPDLKVGRKDFSIKYDLQYFNNNSWKKYGSFISNDKNNYFIEIRSLREINTTRYIVFLSRGLSSYDREIGDFIVNNIRRWNFITRTVGIEVQATEEETSEKVKEEIQNANALIAIATPRNFNQSTKKWTTLDWLQSEFGMDTQLINLY